MRFIEQMRKRRRAKRAAQELRALSPELLRDIGVEPGRIGEIRPKTLSAPVIAAASAPTPIVLRPAPAWTPAWARTSVRLHGRLLKPGHAVVAPHYRPSARNKDTATAAMAASAESGAASNAASARTFSREKRASAM